MAVANCQEYFDTLHNRFIAQAAQDVDAVFQWSIDGSTGGVWYVAVQGGQMTLHEGQHPSPAVTLAANAEDYVKIANGTMNGMRAVMTRRLRVSGNMILAQRMKDFFPAG